MCRDSETAGTGRENGSRSETGNAQQNAAATAAAERAAASLAEAEYVLVGLGSGARGLSYDTLAQVLKGRQYFIITEAADDGIFQSKLLPFLVTAPNSDHDNGQWNAYLNWLTGTIGHSLCMLELGVGLKQAQLIRWPFERTAMINQKAVLVRVNEKLSMLPEGLGERGIRVPMEAGRFLETLLP